jgi:AbrB family looped-hinge helix DNA binding protein
MPQTAKKSIKMKVFPKGQVVIPVSLREKYHIRIGDHVDIVPTQEGILLKSLPCVPEGRSLTDRLFGVFAPYARKRPDLLKEAVVKATEEGFSESKVK